MCTRGAVFVQAQVVRTALVGVHVSFMGLLAVVGGSGGGGGGVSRKR
jgi:hypothetical protein